MPTGENPPLVPEPGDNPPEDQPNEAPPMAAGRPNHLDPGEKAAAKDREDPDNDDGLLLTVEAVLKLLEDQGVPVFCDQYGHAYAYVPCSEPEPHGECVPLKSKRFRNRLKTLVQAEFDKRMSASMLKACVKELEVVAEGMGCGTAGEEVHRLRCGRSTPPVWGPRRRSSVRLLVSAHGLGLGPGSVRAGDRGRRAAGPGQKCLLLLPGDEEA